MKKLMMTMALVAMTFAGRATEVWTLDDSAAMPGSFWTITSPDGKWKLTCVPTDNWGVWEDSEGSADLAVVNDYSTYDRKIETDDVFGSRVVDGGCILKGSGVLRLPTHARDKKGVSHTVEIGNWSLEGWNAPVRKMTKCIVPVDYTAAIGEGTSITADFEVESGNPKYYSRDGALYLRERYRGDGADGDVLLQCPSGKTGSFVIPDNVTKVRSGAFEMSSLSEIVIGPSLEVFESDHEVKDETMKKVTINRNDRFKFVNGFFLGDGGDTVLMVLKSFMKGDVVVPSFVKKIDVCAMAYQEKVSSFVFSSPELTVEHDALCESANFGVFDFSSVGKLTLRFGAIWDGWVKKIYLPENVDAPDGIWLDCSDDLTDVYWPTKMSLDEAERKGIVFQLDEDCRPFTLHVRKDAGYWPERVAIESSQTMKVVKDMTEPADPVLPAFFATGTRVGVKVSGVLTVADYASLKVTGLPSGISVTYDKKGHATFSGAAKKDGACQVVVSYVENGRTVSRVYPLFVDKAPHLALALVADENGTVKGGGDVYVGKKATATATAAKNCVFAGWYADEERETPYASDVDFRTPKLTVANEQADDASLTLYAKFIPVAEDWATVGCEIADEYVTKQAIEPVSVAFDGGSLPTVKVTGLPSGLKFTTKLVTSKVTTGTGKDRVTTLVTNALPYQIYGTPTKSGIFNAKVTVTTAGKATATKDLVFTVLDRAKGERVLRIAYDASAGKATGAGIYAADKKVTLKATAAKNCVFAGWYADSSCTEALAGSVDHRTPSFPYVMPVRDTTVWAKFMPTTEDTGITLAIDGNEVTSAAADTVFNTAGELTLALDVESVSVPKVTVSGLPSGLKFTAKEVLNKDKTVLAEANTIYGTATKPGTYVVTAKLTNTTVQKAIEKKFTIVVDNLTGANELLDVTDTDGAPARLLNARGESYAITNGVVETCLPVILPAESGDKVALSGLPSGLKYNAKTGKIEGAATKAGTFTVQVKVGKAVSTFTIVSTPLPGWAVGTFVGLGIQRFNDVDNGLHAAGELLASDSGILFTLTIAASGKCSCKATTDYESVSIKDLKLIRSFDGELLVLGEGAIIPWCKDCQYRGEFWLRPVEVNGSGVGAADLVWYHTKTKRYDVWLDTEWKDDRFIITEEGFPLLQNVWGSKAIALPTKVEGNDFVLEAPDNRDLVLKFGKSGAVTAALWNKGATKASVVASGQLLLCGYDDAIGVWQGQICLILMDRQRGEVGVIVFVVIDASGVVTCTLEHYEHNWR